MRKTFVCGPLLLLLAACGGASVPVMTPPTAPPLPPSDYSLANQLSPESTLIANAPSFTQIALEDAMIAVEDTETAASVEIFDTYFNTIALTTDGQLLAISAQPDAIPQNATYSGYQTAFAEIVHNDIRYELNAGNTAIHLIDGEIASILLDEFAHSSTLSANPNFFDPNADDFSITLNDFGDLTSCATGAVCSSNATVVLNNPGTINNDSLTTQFTGVFAGQDAQEFGGLIVTGSETSVVRGTFVAQR